MRNKYILALIFSIMLFPFASEAQERVYVSTDKECYLAGEDVWLSVYCMDDSTGEYSPLSKVAYVEFHSLEGLASTVKIALKGGRGCGRLQIPFSFATGNYSIVAYTKLDGGDSEGEFNGKIVTVFNTFSSRRVEGGVEVVSSSTPVKGTGMPQSGSNILSVDIDAGAGNGDTFPVVMKNLSGRGLSLNVSVYHLDPLSELVGEWGYDNTSLLERKGDFRRTGMVDYAGEVLRVKVAPKNGDEGEMKDKLVYMSAIGNTDDIYVNSTNEKGEVIYYTNNIYGTRDLVFEVVGDTARAYNIEIQEWKAPHRAARIPVLRISPKMGEALRQRGLDMQITRRFASDTIYDFIPGRATSFFGTVEYQEYNLDDYTRFPVMSEVVAEYVKALRIRKDGGETVMRVLWEPKGRALVLLDGVPVTDHSTVVNLDPLLVKSISVYPKRFILNYLVYDGIVKFNTYKGDMGGIRMGNNVSVVAHKGVQYPLAFMGSGVTGNSNYPNFNGTIYWNPAVEAGAGEEIVLECVKPQYKGKFKMVVEGIDSEGDEVYFSTTFNL